MAIATSLPMLRRIGESGPLSPYLQEPPKRWMLMPEGAMEEFLGNGGKVGGCQWRTLVGVESEGDERKEGLHEGNTCPKSNKKENGPFGEIMHANTENRNLEPGASHVSPSPPTPNQVNSVAHRLSTLRCRLQMAFSVPIPVIPNERRGIFSPFDE